MQLGFSSYSFHQRLSTGSMTILDVIDWIADHDGAHLELAAIYPTTDSPLPTPDSDPEFVTQVRAHAADRGVTLSNLCIGANFLTDGQGGDRRRGRAGQDLGGSGGVAGGHDDAPRRGRSHPVRR